jgi:hypothetical protein
MERALVTGPGTVKGARRIAIVVLAAALLAPPPLSAQTPQVAPGSPVLPAAAPPSSPQAKPSSAPSPALDFGTARTAPRPVTERWWFWTAVGTVVVATAVLLVLANREPAPPATTLGNQEFKP